jgi:hypothetical protein
MQRQFDSAITRVRPFFQPLLKRDPSGAAWLPTLLRLGNANPRFGDQLARQCGPLLDWVSQPRTRPDRALRQFGIASVELEDCFEHRLPPPEAFLRWLIENPQVMIMPREDAITSSQAQRRRQELFGQHGPDAAASARAEALAELARVGPAGSSGKWWAFEGFTIADCLLETEHLFLLIEGKRTEPLSLSTRWFGQRNQLLRHLEVAEAVARQRAASGKASAKKFAVLLLAEDHVSYPSLDAMAAGLAHLHPDHRGDLMGHYLGCVTWAQALAAVYFPHTVADAADQVRRASPLTAAG